MHASPFSNRSRLLAVRAVVLTLTPSGAWPHTSEPRRQQTSVDNDTNSDSTRVEAHLRPSSPTLTVYEEDRQPPHRRGVSPDHWDAQLRGCWSTDIPAYPFRGGHARGLSRDGYPRRLQADRVLSTHAR